MAIRLIRTLIMTQNLRTSKPSTNWIPSWRSDIHPYLMNILDWVFKSWIYWQNAPNIRPAHTATMTKSTQSPYEFDKTIKICSEDIWRSSNWTIFLTPDSYAIQGSSLDPGEQKSVIGKRQVVVYSKQHNIRYALMPSLTYCKFSDGVFFSLELRKSEFLHQITRSWRSKLMP